MVGGVQVTLDLAGAFDAMPRHRLLEGTQHLRLPSALIDIVMCWHQQAHYHINHDGVDRVIHATQRVRQGCAVAPLVWLVFSHLISGSLAAKIGRQATQDLLSIFADDYHCSGLFHTEYELDETLMKIAALLRALAEMGMLVSPSKSKAILRCTGPGTGQLKRKHIRKTSTGKVLRVRSANDCVDIPLVDSFTYLGAIVSYDHFEDRALAHRLEVGSGNFGRLTRVLRGRNALARRHKLRVWQACVYTSTVYGLDACGLAPMGAKRLTAQIVRQIRLIVRDPVYMIGNSNHKVLDAWDMTPPVEALRCQLLQETEDSSPDIFRRGPGSAAWHRALNTLVETHSAQIIELPNSGNLGVPHGSADGILRPPGTGAAPSHGVDGNQEGSRARLGPFGEEQSLAHGAGQGAPVEPGPGNKQRWRKGGGKGQNTANPNITYLVEALARLALQQETAIKILRQDYSWVLFAQPGNQGPLPLLFAAAQKWKKAQEEGATTTALRTTLFGCLLQMLHTGLKDALLLVLPLVMLPYMIHRFHATRPLAGNVTRNHGVPTGHLQPHQGTPDGLERDGAITLSEMEQFFNDEEVRAMFQSLDLTARDSWTLFKLLDEEGNGDINLSEFIDGCLRLRGPAKALDIACVMDESRRIKRKVMITEERLYNMEALVGELSSKFQSTSVRKEPVAPKEDPPLLSSLGPGGFVCGATAGGPWMQHDECLHLPDVPFDVGPDLGRPCPPQRMLRGRDTRLMNAKGNTEEPHFPDLLYDLGPHSFPLKQLSF
eukprot:s3814_g1.t3